jgi:hypothetical protein
MNPILVTQHILAIFTGTAAVFILDGNLTSLLVLVVCTSYLYLETAILVVGARALGNDYSEYLANLIVKAIMTTIYLTLGYLVYYTYFSIVV